MHDVCSAVCKSIQVGLVVNRYTVTIRYYPPLTGNRPVPFYLIRSRLWMKPRNPEQPTKHVWNHAYIHQKDRIKGNEGGWLLIFIYYCLPSAFVKHVSNKDIRTEAQLQQASTWKQTHLKFSRTPTSRLRYESRKQLMRKGKSAWVPFCYMPRSKPLLIRPV